MPSSAPDNSSAPPISDKVTALIYNLRTGVIFEDQQRVVVDANPAFCRMWQLPVPATALLGRSAAEVAWPPDRWWVDPMAIREKLEALARARQAVFALELRTTDNRVVEVDYIPVLCGGVHGGAFWVYSDTTESRRSEEEIRTLNHELEQRVSQRTYELARSNRELANSLRRLGETQEQLIHAGKMAAVGTLVAGLSHELNNPLGIIVGYVQGLLRRMSEQAAGRESLVAVERQALRCAHLVRSLLDFSRSKPTVREQTSLGPLIERVLELAAGHAKRRQVALRWMARSPVPELTICTQEIESALLNLVSNAIDATPPGGSTSVVVAPATHLGRSGVEINITDTGSGIARAVLPRIFDPFFTTKPVGEGTGIGLSLTRQIVEGHSGRIEVRSAEHVGTTMRLWLPLQPDPELRLSAEPERTVNGDGETMQSPKIPAANDNQTVNG